MKRFISSILTVVLVFLYCSSFALSTSAQTDKTLDISNDIEALNDVSHCAEGEYDALNLDCGKRYFSNEEKVVAIFDLKSDSGYTILDMYYDNENFVVISAAVSSEGNQIVFELLCPSYIDNYHLSVEATLENEETVKADFYALKNEYGVFTAPDSTDSAYECYYAFAMENNILTFDECSDLRQERYRVRYDNMEPTIIQPSANGNNGIALAASAKTTYVSGTLSWLDDDNVSHPLRGVKIEVFDEDNTGDELLLTLYTSDNGTYSGSFENKDGFFEFENGGYDVFLRIHAGDSRVVVRNSNSALYYVDTSVTNNISSGTNLNHSRTFSMANGDLLGQAFQISQALITAKNYASAMGTTPPVVYCEYPCIEQNGFPAYYTNGNSTIHIKFGEGIGVGSPNSYASWDLIMHEYGHHVEFYNDIIGDFHTNKERNHSAEENLIDNYYKIEEIGYDQYDKHNGILLAWSEGWATAFSLLAQQYYYTNLSGIYSICDTSYRAYNKVFYDLEFCNNLARGEGSEATVSGIIWDIFDSPSTLEPFDEFSLSHREIWDLTTQSGTYTFHDMYYLSVLTNRENELKFAKLLTEFEVSSSKPLMTNASTVSVTVPPTFEWSAQGGSTYCPNNLFDLFIFDASGSSVFLKILYTTSYTLTQDEWESVIDELGSGAKIYVSILTSQTTSITTGPYPSEALEYILP